MSDILENHVDISQELYVIENEPRGKAVKDAIHDALVKIKNGKETAGGDTPTPDPPGMPRIIKTLDTIDVPGVLSIESSEVESISPYNVYPPGYSGGHPSPYGTYGASFPAKSYPYLGVIITFSYNTKNLTEQDRERYNYPKESGWESLLFGKFGDRRIFLDNSQAKDDTQGQTVTPHHQTNYFDVYWQYFKDNYNKSNSTGFNRAGNDEYFIRFIIPYAKYLTLVEQSVVSDECTYTPPTPTGKPRLYIFAHCAYKPKECSQSGYEVEPFYGRSLYKLHTNDGFYSVDIWYDCQPDLMRSPSFYLEKGENAFYYEASYGADSIIYVIDIDYEEEAPWANL